MAEEKQLGLIQLWPPTDSTVETRLDIVAIHGLGGHPLKTWTDGDKLWLRDFLPTSIPEARVLTYGYDSGIAFDKSASEIPDFARDLLERVRAVRRKGSKNRPIIVVCHSLGGIVFKKALVIAHERERYADLLQCVKSVMFMGTPHRGADVAYWSKILGKIANIPLLGSIRTNLLRDLEPKSKVLGEVCSQFVERGKKLQIFSFYERVKTSGLNDLVVDQDSAILHLPNETPLPVEADHRGMCKFLTANDQRFQIVLSSLQELVEETEGDEESNLSPAESSFVNKLCDVDPTLVFDQIPDSHEDTCHWIKQNPIFQRWVNKSQSNFLWISGSAGCGKSVLTKYIIKQLSSRRSTETARKFRKASGDSSETVCYVFCSDKEARGNNTPAVLRSLLFQILYQNSELIRYIKADHLKPTSQGLSIAALQECLSNVVLQGRNINYWVIIDALDEMPANAAKALLQQLDQLMSKDLVGRLRVMVTSRQEPPSSLEHAGICNLITMDLDLTAVHRDVETFVAGLVKEFCAEHAFPAATIETLKTGIISRSQGLFLLASLNWTAFSDGVSYWSKRTVSSQLENLEKLPSTYESLYCNLLERIPSDFRPLLKRIFMWMLVVRQPLALSDLHYAISVEAGHRSYKDIEDDLVFDFRQVLRRFCGQFLKVGSQDEVQFRHQYVKDILLRKSVDQQHEHTLRQYRSSLAACEYHVNQVCLNMLSWKDFSTGQILDDIKRRYVENEVKDKSSVAIERSLRGSPLLLYMARFWPNHLRFVQDEPELVEHATKFFLSTNLRTYRKLRVPWTDAERSITFNRPIHFHGDTPPLHALIQMGDFVNIAKRLIMTGLPINEIDPDNMTPLHWTIARGRKKIFQLLMHHPRIEPNKGNVGKDKSIHICLDPTTGRLDAFKSLLSFTSVDVNSRGHQGQTALHRVVQHHDRLEQWLDPLLERRDVDLNITDDEGLVPLIVALSSGNGQSAALKLLRQPEDALDVSVTDKNGTNTLSLASMRGWVDVRRLLQKRDRSQVFAYGTDGMNALTRAAFFGQKKMLEGLLRDSGRDDIHRYGNLGRFNLVNLCAQQDWEDVVELLRTAYGLESQEQDDRGRTILHWAALSGWSYSYTSHSDKQRAMVNVQDHDGRTALHLAAENRNLEAAKFLVKEGANCLLRDKSGKTAAHVAADAGSRAILELLLNTRIKDFGRDRDGCTLLHFIATWEWKPVLTLYLSKNRSPVDMTDKKRRTPLHLAAIYGNMEIVRELLRNAADIARRDSLGFTAVHYAIQQGHADVLSQLLEHKADIYQLDGFQRTSLQIALGARQHHLFDFIMSKGVDVNPPDRLGKTAVQKAAYLGDTRIVEALIEAGADINAKDNQGATALHCAVIVEDLNVVAELLRYPKTLLSEEDSLGCSPLDWATVLNLKEIANLLKWSGAVHSRHYTSKLRLYTKLPSSSNYVWHDWPVRPYAAIEPAHGYGDAERSNAIDGRSSGGVAPVPDSVRKPPTKIPAPSHSPRPQKSEQRQRNKINVEPSKSREVVRNSVLHEAAAAGNYDLLTRTLHAGANPIIENQGGMTPAQIAARGLNSQILRALIESGADIAKRSVDGESLLHLAIGQHIEFDKEHRAIETVRLLLKCGIDVNMKDTRGRTAMDCANWLVGGRATALILTERPEAWLYLSDKGLETAMRWPSPHQNLTASTVRLPKGVKVTDPSGLLRTCTNVHFLQALFEQGAHPNRTRAANGDAPLHIWAREQHMEVESVQCLLEYGANVNAVNNFGETPLMRLATSIGTFRGIERKADIARALLAAGADPLLQADGGHGSTAIDIARYMGWAEGMKIMQAAARTALASNSDRTQP